MNHVNPVDRLRCLNSRHDNRSAIVTSRKRKLRELFAVATDGDHVPNRDFTAPDAPRPTIPEKTFLQQMELLQPVQIAYTFAPPRPKVSIDHLRQFIGSPSRFFVEGPVSPPRLFGPGVSEPHAPKSNLTTTELKTPAHSSSGIVHLPLKLELQKHDETLDPIEPSGRRSTCSHDVESEHDGIAINSVAGSLGTTPVSIGANSAVLDPSRDASPPSASPSSCHSPIPDKNEDHVDGARQAEEMLPSPTSTRVIGVTFGPKKPPLAIPLIPPGPTSHLSRLHHAISSPCSTVVTATTPAVHDHSTDTSPENDVPTFGNHTIVDLPTKYLTSADGHEHSPAVVKRPMPILRPDSVEAQILRESADYYSPKLETATTAPPQRDDDLAAQDAVMNALHISIDGQPAVAVRSPLASTLPRLPEPGVPQSSCSQDPRERSVSLVDARPFVDGLGVSAAETVPNLADQQPSTLGPRPSIPEAAKLPPPVQAVARAVTRVSSGALKQRSVSEILGEAPRITSVDKPVNHKTVRCQPSPISTFPAPITPQTSSHSEKRKERPRGKISTVVFGKPARQTAEAVSVYSQHHKQPSLVSQDYFSPLFINVAQVGHGLKSLDVLLHQAYKVVSTADFYVSVLDNQACKILRRILHLQQKDKWSLRQLKRWPEPTRPPSHYDILLQEMKWMRTDFREERKWKVALARNLAYACAEWVAATAVERITLQVAARIPPAHSALLHVDEANMTEQGGGSRALSTSALFKYSTDSNLPERDETTEKFDDTPAPADIFSLEEDDVIFGLRRSPTADQLLNELPLYGAPLQVPQFDVTGAAYDTDATWRRPAVAVSKYVAGELSIRSASPPRKRGRYDYESDEDSERECELDQGRLAKRLQVGPETKGMALFNPAMKYIKDKAYAGHLFRPPMQPIPSQSFLEYRSASQWTPSEDEELVDLVHKYSYNWALISSTLSFRSSLSSPPERRTAWECFERWTTLEGITSDGQKTPYLKVFFNRLEAAQKTIKQHNQSLQQQQAGSVTGGGGPTSGQRRRLTAPVSVERRRNQRHLTLIEAMRRLAKKREAALQKQQNAAVSAANRKTNETTMPRGPLKTPRDYCLIRWERDHALAQKLAQFNQRTEASRRAALQQAKLGGLMSQIAGTPMAMAAGQAAGAAPVLGGAVNGPAPLAAVGRAGIAQQAPVPVQIHPRGPMQPAVNGMAALPPPGRHPNGLGPGPPPIQPIQASHRAPIPTAAPPNANVMIQARRISEQQRAQVHLQQQQSPGTMSPSPQCHQSTHSLGAVNRQSPPSNMRNAVNGIGLNQQSYLANAQAMMASYTAATGVGSGGGSSGIGTPSGSSLHVQSAQSSSPPSRYAVGSSQLPPVLASNLSSIEDKIRQTQPSLPPDQVRRIAMEHLHRLIVQRQTMTQSAMNAAAGALAASMAVNTAAVATNMAAATTSPHQYAALLRHHQQQQAQQAQQAQQQQQQAQQAAQDAGQHQMSPLQVPMGSPALSMRHQRSSSGSAPPPSTLPIPGPT